MEKKINLSATGCKNLLHDVMISKRIRMREERLARLIAINAPQQIIDREKKLVEEAKNELIVKC